MKPEYSIVLSFIFFSISILMMYTSTFYSQDVPDQIAESIGKEKLLNTQNLDPNKIDPFDFYTSRLENYIIYVCFFLGGWFFIDLLPLNKINKKGEK